MLGAGHILVQRYGDILDGKRTWPKELAQSNVKPTLKDAVAGDITAAMPYRCLLYTSGLQRFGRKKATQWLLHHCVAKKSLIL